MRKVLMGKAGGFFVGLIFAIFSVHAPAQDLSRLNRIAELRAKVSEDGGRLRVIQDQIFNSKNSSAEKMYVEQKIKLDDDRDQLNEMVDIVIREKTISLRKSYAEFEAAELVGDESIVPSIQADIYRKIKEIDEIKRGLLGSNF